MFPLSWIAVYLYLNPHPQQPPKCTSVGKFIKSQLALHHMSAICFRFYMSIGLSGDKFSCLLHQIYS